MTDPPSPPADGQGALTYRLTVELRHPAYSTTTVDGVTEDGMRVIYERYKASVAVAGYLTIDGASPTIIPHENVARMFFTKEAK